MEAGLLLRIPPVFNYFLASAESFLLCQLSKVCHMLVMKVSANFSETKKNIFCEISKWGTTTESFLNLFDHRNLFSQRTLKKKCSIDHNLGNTVINDLEVLFHLQHAIILSLCAFREKSQGSERGKLFSYSL